MKKVPRGNQNVEGSSAVAGDLKGEQTNWRPPEEEKT